MLFVICPHCSGMVEVLEINCAIFRHGVFADTGQQVPPHCTQEEHLQWVRSGRLIGCGFPFRVRRESTGDLVAEPCEYI